jgi:hypothetical protein
MASLQIRGMRERKEQHIDCIESFLAGITARMRLEKYRSEGTVTLPEIDWVTAHIITTLFLPELSVGEDSEFLQRLLEVTEEKIAEPLSKIIETGGDTSAISDEELSQIEEICYKVAFKMSKFTHGIIYGVRHLYN